MIGFRVHYILSMTILFLFLIMGVFLGLVGAGGSILSIPILTYGVGMPMVKASAFSFLIVMLLAIIALIQVRATLSLKEYLPFALPTLIAVMVVRAWLLPVINMQMGMHFYSGCLRFYWPWSCWELLSLYLNGIMIICRQSLGRMCIILW